MRSEAAKRLLERWDNFNAGNANYEEAYNNLAKYAREDWEALRSALSTDAEPVRWMWEERRGSSEIWDFMYDDAKPDPHAYIRNVTPLYAAPPAPAVAVKVKPLEWKEGNPGSYTEIAESPFGHYSVWEINGTGCWAPWKQGSGSIVDGGLAGAKAAAQADYEARIRSALSAQVQDVAGWQPIETAPKRGDYLVYQPETKSGRSTLSARIIPNFSSGYSRPTTHWMPLPAAPAAKQGEAE